MTDSPTEWGLCPATMNLDLEGPSGGQIRAGELRCMLTPHDDGPHLDPSGHVQWMATPAGMQHQQELEAHRAYLRSPEAQERWRAQNLAWQSARAEQRDRHASKYAKGKERIRDWLADGGGQLCWRDEEVLTSVNGGQIVMKASTAHVWFGQETACGHEMPKSAILHNEMPEEPVRICRTCASMAARKRLPSIGAK